MDGARFEDGFNCGDTRSENHFYDPIYNSGLIWHTEVITPLASIPIAITGQKSPDWALKDQILISGQNFSFSDARQYLYEALTVPNLDSRNRKFGLTFQTLGQVIHHLQDMAQPQHVRNDPHYIAPGQECSQIVQTLGGYLRENPSRYEKYTDDHRSELPFVDQAGLYKTPVYPGTDPTLFNTARKFWVTQEGSGGTGLGIAEFTNNNFVSAGTNFALINGQAAVGSRYPLPQPGAPSTVPVSQLFTQKGQSVPAGIQTACGQSGDDCMMTFYSTRVRDFYTHQFVDNPYGSTLSLFDQDLAAHNQTVTYTDPNTGETWASDRVFSLNQFNFDAAHQFLIPRAVAYSAGLINYFFRGKLEAVDAGFSDEGISLRVKNAIDAKTGESIFADGSLVISYDYKTADLETVVGSSPPVTLTESLAPGKVSQNLYTFVVPAFPPGATDIKYRLVFRGQLGQEKDAIAVGAVKPVSGFVVTPNYPPQDGITGSRSIYKTAGEWRLSAEQGLVAGNIDWKGGYVDGVPTKVLSWAGPVSRYFEDYGYDATGHPHVRSPFDSAIYQNGERFAVAPAPVLGAAIARDSAGQEWLIAICHDGTADIVYRRPNNKNGAAGLFDPQTAPEGWKKIGELSRQPGDQPAATPWFFNGRGTEAQTLRRWIDPADTQALNQFKRLKMTLVDMDTASIEDIGNLAGFTDAQQCSGGYDSDGAGTVTRTQQNYGEYIIAVDYKDDQEVLATIKADGGASYASTVIVTKITRADGTVDKKADVVLTVNSSYRETLKWGGQDLVTLEDITSANGEGGDTSGYHLDFTNNYRSAYATYHLDLRYDLYAYSSEQFSTQISDDLSGNNIHRLQTTAGEDAARLKSNLRADLPIFTQTSPPVQSEQTFPRGTSLPVIQIGALAVCRPEDNAAFQLWESNFPNATGDGDGGIAGAWAVDARRRLLVSQGYYSDGGYERHDGFNYFSDGDLSAIVPPGAADARYYPAGVVR